MDRDQEYRRQAAQAQAWADKAKTDQDRAAWLKVAEGWLGLLRKRPQTAEEQFEEVAHTQGTGQDPSSEAH
jgi:hypothetical protein